MKDNNDYIEITAEQAARNLINMYYDHAKSQLEAIEICERVVLTTLCQKIDSLHGHMFFRKDFDQPLIESSIRQLKWQQEIACELQRMKMNIPV